MNNPFYTGRVNGQPVGPVSAQDRIDRVQRFNRQQCEQAQAIEGLQKSVQAAISRRLRQLKTLDNPVHDNMRGNPLVECCRCRHKHHFAQRRTEKDSAGELVASQCPRCTAQTFNRAEDQPDIFTGVAAHE